MTNHANPKTSLSHPLRIDTLVLDDIPALKGIKGCIGLTFCPGKNHRSYFSGEWQRDLAIDIQAIQNWGASAWLNTMEARDLLEVKISPTDFENAVHAANIAYYHLPIVDGGIPDSETEHRWQKQLSPLLRQHLLNDERLLIHCRGGLGRTGTLAARLLVELGCDPDDAINRVRTIRPGAIETPQQANWVAK